jgi:hypothetical protein
MIDGPLGTKPPKFENAKEDDRYHDDPTDGPRAFPQTTLFSPTGWLPSPPRVAADPAGSSPGCYTSVGKM